LGLKIAVLCTFGVILQMACYKYQAALPHLNNRMFFVFDGSVAYRYLDVFNKYLIIQLKKGFLQK
jgi:hypothetical protein